MKKLLSLLLCLMLLGSMAQFSLAEEEMAMLAVEDVIPEAGPIDLVAPDEDLPSDELAIEALEASIDLMTTRRETVEIANADSRSALIALCKSIFADFAGENELPEGLESFDNLDASYQVTADSYLIDIPDNFTKDTASCTSTNFIYKHSYSDMIVSVGLLTQTSAAYNYNYLATNGFTPQNATFNSVPVVYGVKHESGKFHWLQLFNTPTKTVMLQALYSDSYSSTCTPLTSTFFSSVKPGNVPLTVSAPVFSISADSKHIFITRPVVTGGTGKYTYAYNIYDSSSNPVNYFYSDAENVAATPGYNGLFNVFVVVSDGVSSKTVDIGWQTLTGNEPMSVTASSWSISANKKHVFINKPKITGGTRQYTIAYNIYDSKGNPVNYFYSNEEAVAVSPNYNGTFNIYIVVTDGQTTKSLMTGWFTLTGY